MLARERRSALIAKDFSSLPQLRFHERRVNSRRILAGPCAYGRPGGEEREVRGVLSEARMMRAASSHPVLLTWCQLRIDTDGGVAYTQNLSLTERCN